MGPPDPNRHSGLKSDLVFYGNGSAGLARGSTIFQCDASVMHMRAFTVRLAEEDLRRLDAKARKRGISKAALLRDRIRGSEDRTVANIRIWEEGNLGNQGFRIRCD
jgi:hypothetical protein